MSLAPFFGKLTFDRSFENGGFVAFEIRLDPLEIGDGFVQTGELLFYHRDDKPLLIKAEPRGFQDRRYKMWEHAF